MTDRTEVLSQVRGVLDKRYPAEETIRLIRRLLDPPRQQQPIEHTERGWPVLRASEIRADRCARRDESESP
jgi:hypothetical protein